jgi:hypothetical protein
MVNQQDKDKEYYPKAKQGDSEGKSQDYNRNAQQPGAPNQTDSTLKYPVLQIHHIKISPDHQKTYQDTARYIRPCKAQPHYCPLQGNQ